MEPSGLMDNQLGSRICDTADEEVHFCRETLARQQPFAAGDSSSQHVGYPYQPPVYKPSSVLFSDVTLDKQPDSLQSLQSNSSGAHEHQQVLVEQARSNRLLALMGARLRRCSHLLAAPKLVGQYLLGISVQSWSEFLDTSRMMRAPTNTQQLIRRLLANLAFFQGNYLCVSLVLIIYCILTSPLLLLTLICYLLALYVATARIATGKQIRIGTYRPNLQQQYSFITLVSLPLLWVAGAPSAVFWVIGASFVVVGLHASMYAHPNLASTGPPTGDLSLAYLQHQQQLQPQNYQQLQLRPQATQYHNHNNNITYSQHPATATCVPQSPTESRAYTYTGAISHWVGLGASTASRPSRKVPDVTIISHDYAGLGRVYEI